MLQYVSFAFGLIGFPSLITVIGVLASVFKKIKILMKAQQAQMRSQLLDQYHRYEKQGWISEDDLLDWENQYQAYHSLGANGVLDKRREALMAMPSFPPSTSASA